MSDLPGANPLLLSVIFEPERAPSPTEGADVTQSVDDVYRLLQRLRFVDDRLRDPADLFSASVVGHGETQLILRELRFGSPLSFVIEIPWIEIGSGILATGGIWGFLTSIEYLWNMPRRIRVESARLNAELAEHERDMWRARLEALDAKRQYWATRRTHSGRFLQGEIDEPAFRALDGRIYDREDQG